jgi:hypothetical protein
MNIIKTLAFIAVAGISACSTPKSYFTAETKNRIDANSIPVQKLQFYIDKDVELRRELSSKDDTKVSSGKVILENGKYVNIILLKKGTPGICTNANGGMLDIAFESGNNKNISFALPLGANSNTAYSLSAEKWLNNYNTAEVGKITYDGQVYFMRFNGARPKLMIKKSDINNYEVNKRTMKGRKIK